MEIDLWKMVLVSLKTYLYPLSILSKVDFPAPIADIKNLVKIGRLLLS